MKTSDKNLTSKKDLPGTSQPQDLGTISYKDMTTQVRHKQLNQSMRQRRLF